MKVKYIILFILIIGVLKSTAQQLPEYTQYTFNELLVNPATTGIESYWDVKSGYRSQWTGLQGAPVTTYLTLSVPFSRSFTENDYTQMIRNSDNPLGKYNVEGYHSSAPHSGLGFSLITDKTAQIRQTHVDISYAYHIQFFGTLNFAVGTSVGLTNISLNTGEITLTDATDAAISQGVNSQYKPEASIGVWAYGARFFAGASVQQLIPSTVSFSKSSSSNQGKTYAQYFFTAGYRAFISDDVTWLPSVVVRPFQQNGPFSYDFNSKFEFKDIFWLGGTYRKDDAVSGSFGFNFAAFLTLGYSYDYTTSALNNVSYGTHEIQLGLFIKNNYNVTSPRHTW